MNIESRADQAKGLRAHTIRGKNNLSEIKIFLGKLYDSAEFDPTVHALWDLREAVFPDVTPAEIKELAYFVRSHWAEKHRHKTAVVISGDFHFGLSRMFEQFVGPPAHGKIKTFRDLRTAADWLDNRASAVPLPPNE